MLVNNWKTSFLFFCWAVRSLFIVSVAAVRAKAHMGSFKFKSLAYNEVIIFVSQYENVLVSKPCC